MHWEFQSKQEAINAAVHETRLSKKAVVVYFLDENVARMINAPEAQIFASDQYNQYYDYITLPSLCGVEAPQTKIAEEDVVRALRLNV